MKELSELKDEVKTTKSSFNRKNLLKYILIFTVVTLSTLIIPTCGVLKSQAVCVGLIAGSTFAIIDMLYPNKVYINGFHH
tara:strand:- start:149 stop:388 length:240 start_codon:yes stop_codon:yes gene_type:complete